MRPRKTERVRSSYTLTDTDTHTHTVHTRRNEEKTGEEEAKQGEGERERERERKRGARRAEQSRDGRTIQRCTLDQLRTKNTACVEQPNQQHISYSNVRHSVRY